tara:strand:- start:2155 stop:2631 length:477 start_codon:yes stop_codon:yes gene_type:complete
MAYLIFNLNDFSGINQIAENDSILNENKNFHNEHRSIVTINNTDFLNFKKGLANFVSCDGSNVVWNPLVGTEEKPFPFYTEAAAFDKEINFYQSCLEKWLAEPRTNDKPMRASVIAFRDYLLTIDSSSIITEGNPLEKTLVQYVMDQGQTAYHPCELL